MTINNRNAAIYNSLEDLRRRYSNDGNHIPSANTIIDTLLDSLGWERFGGQVEYCFELSDGHQTDYALKATKDTPVIAIELIEDRQFGTHLSKHPNTLRRAAESNISIYIMTTGTVWSCYLTKEAQNKQPDELSFLELNIFDMSISTDTLVESLKNVLSIELVSSGHAQEIAELLLEDRQKEILIKRRLPLIWQEMLYSGDEKLVSVLGRRFHTEFGFNADKERLEATIKSTSRYVRTQQKHSSNKYDVNPERYILFGEEYSINAHIQALIHIVETLHQRDSASLIRLLELPYFSRDAADFRASAEINNSGIYIDKWAGIKTIWDRAHVIMRHLGYELYDLNLVYLPTVPH